MGRFSKKVACRPIEGKSFDILFFLLKRLFMIWCGAIVLLLIEEVADPTRGML